MKITKAALVRLNEALNTYHGLTRAEGYHPTLSNPDLRIMDDWFVLKIDAFRWVVSADHYDEILRLVTTKGLRREMLAAKLDQIEDEQYAKLD